MDLNEFYLINVRITDGLTVWVSDYMVRKMCGVSEGYLSKARSLYKKAVGSSLKIAIGAKFFLPKGSRSWRWGFCEGRFFYDIDAIPNHAPTCYRSLLPDKEDLVWLIHFHLFKKEERWIEE